MKLSSIFLTGMLLAGMLIGCRFDYDEPVGPYEREDLPDFMLKGFSYTVNMGDGSRVLFTGTTGSFRDDRRTAELNEVEFLQFNQEGELLTIGYSRSAVINTDTEDALLSGDVVVDALEKDLVIRSSSLSWKREPQLLVSQPGEEVTMEQSSGTMISGYGFTGDLYRREFTFSEHAEGTLYDNTE